MFKIRTVLAALGFAFVLPLVAANISPDSSFSSSAQAQEEKKQPKYKDVKTRQRASVGKKCASALEKVQVIEQELWAESLEQLKSIEASTKTCDSDYEQTQIWKFMGYVYYSLDDFPGAIGAYQKVINGEGTPEELRLDTRYTLAQLYTVEEQYGLAIEQFEIWMDAAFAVGAEQHLMMAQLYHLLGRENEALEMTNLGIAEAEVKGSKLADDFCKLQLSIYFQIKNYQKVKSLMEKLNKNNPEWVY